MTRCSACNLPIEDFASHYPFAHQEEYVGPLQLSDYEERELVERVMEPKLDWGLLLLTLATLLLLSYLGHP